MHANMFTKIMATIIVINADNEVHMLQAAIINCKAQYRLEREIVKLRSIASLHWLLQNSSLYGFAM